MHSGDLSQSPARSINRRELKSEYAEHQAFLFTPRISTQSYSS